MSNKEIGHLVDVVIEADDLGGQSRLLMSPKTYRSLIQPLIPDLINAGIDLLNPVQISSPGMELDGLKREFGRDLTFWGGGIDTQRVLETGTPKQIREHVKRNIEILASVVGLSSQPCTTSSPTFRRKT